jgi:hypothetical protein
MFQERALLRRERRLRKKDTRARERATEQREQLLAATEKFASKELVVSDSDNSQDEDVAVENVSSDSDDDDDADNIEAFNRLRERNLVPSPSDVDPNDDETIDKGVALMFQERALLRRERRLRKKDTRARERATEQREQLLAATTTGVGDSRGHMVYITGVIGDCADERDESFVNSDHFDAQSAHSSVLGSDDEDLLSTHQLGGWHPHTISNSGLDRME